MKAIIPGHSYELSHLDGDGYETLNFVRRPPYHEPFEGTTNQEVCRVLIDRIKTLDREVPWEGNKQILYHLRMVIALHEGRALLRHVEKHGFEIENVRTGTDGHFVLVEDFDEVQ